MSQHKKHTTLKKSHQNLFHPYEWTILGSSCDFITDFVTSIMTELSFCCGFYDVSHKITFSKNYNCTTLIKEKEIHQCTTTLFSAYEVQQLFLNKTLLFLNGNHFLGKNQIVIQDPLKTESLKRKADKLNDISLVLTTDSIPIVYDFLKIEPRCEILNINDVSSIIQFLENNYLDNLPKINGLVLTGGKSSRMGRDKASLNYKGKNHADYLADICSELNFETFISISDHSTNNYNYPVIKDEFLNLGPLGGILSGFKKYPNFAWLTIACDLALVDKHVINLLISQRDPNKVATCFYNESTRFPEPLITIWEPKSYPILLHFLSQGYSCPRKVLINCDTKIAYIENQEKLMNVNNQSDYAKAKSMIKKH